MVEITEVPALADISTVNQLDKVRNAFIRSIVEALAAGGNIEVLLQAILAAVDEVELKLDVGNLELGDINVNTDEMELLNRHIANTSQGPFTVATSGINIGVDADAGADHETEIFTTNVAVDFTDDYSSGMRLDVADLIEAGNSGTWNIVAVRTVTSPSYRSSIWVQYDAAHTTHGEGPGVTLAGAGSVSELVLRLRAIDAGNDEIRSLLASVINYVMESAGTSDVPAGVVHAPTGSSLVIGVDVDGTTYGALTLTGLGDLSELFSAGALMSIAGAANSNGTFRVRSARSSVLYLDETTHSTFGAGWALPGAGVTINSYGVPSLSTASVVDVAKSVATTSSSVPGEAILIGAEQGGNLEALTRTASGLEVDVVAAALPAGAATEATLDEIAEACETTGGAIVGTSRAIMVGVLDGGSNVVHLDKSGNGLEVDVVASALPAGAATEATVATLATEATAATLALESGGNLDTIAGDTTSLDAKVTNVSGKVDVGLFASDGTGITQTGGALDVNIGSQAIQVAVDLDNADDDVLVYGWDGAANQKIKTDANGELQVDVLSSALPAGAATEATVAALALESGGNLDTIAGDTTSIDGKITACDTGAVTVTASALPAGAATEATLATLDGKVTACNTGNVTVAASALPANAAQETGGNLASIKTNTDQPTAVLGGTATTSGTPNTPTNPFTGSPKRTVTFHAAAGNAADILIGNNVGQYLPIAPGETQDLDIDDLSKVYVKSSSATQTITYVGS